MGKLFILHSLSPERPERLKSLLRNTKYEIRNTKYEIRNTKHEIRNMTTSATQSQQQVPSSVGKQPAYSIQHYALRVRRARRWLHFLFWAILVTGLLTTAISFLAVNDTLARYQKIVADSADSADAAQQARLALLRYHRAAADFLSLKASLDDEEATQALQRSTTEWVNYQDALRNFWRNTEQNQSDAQFGENEVFKAADSATWRYKAGIDAMIALVEVEQAEVEIEQVEIEIGLAEAAEKFFLQSNQTLRREVLPALNGLENMKLESMEEAYATTNAAISTWQQLLMVIGGLAVLLLITGFALTRFWLHYAWTWELAIASLIGLVLFGWFNVTLIRAANQAEVLVRDAYDTLSGIQSVEALLTQTEVVKSMAIFNSQQALNFPEKADSYREQASHFLSDGDAYLFLLEQRLCGEPQLANESEKPQEPQESQEGCIDRTFLDESGISEQAKKVAEKGKEKYGLRRNPLILNAFTNDFEGEAEKLEDLRNILKRYKQAKQRRLSQDAYGSAIDLLMGEGELRSIVKTEFDNISNTVTQTMKMNWWLAFIFSGLGLLGAWGIRRRRQALFAS
jgi:hypothetical protein